jgi:hypothetical protein
MTPVWRVFAHQAEKNPFVFKGRSGGLEEIRQLLFVRFVQYQWVVAAKAWNPEIFAAPRPFSPERSATSITLTHLLFFRKNFGDNF